MTTGSNDSVRSKFDQNWNRQKPVRDEVLPKNPVSIPPIGLHEATRSILHEVSRQRQIFRDEQVIGGGQQDAQLEQFGQMSTAGRRQQNAEFLRCGQRGAPRRRRTVYTGVS